MSLSIAFGNGDGHAADGGSTTIDITAAEGRSIDTTGATHLAAAVKWEGADTTVTMSDNKSSGSWNSLTKESHTNGDLHQQMFWVKIGSPGSGHEVTATLGAAREFRTLAVWIITASGAELEVDAQATAEGSSSTPADAGSLATSGASVVSVLAIGPYATRTWTEGTGWTESYEGLPPGGGNVSVAGYHRGAETTTPIDPFATPSSALDWVANAVSFREPTGGGAYNAVPLLQSYYQTMRRSGVFH